MQNQYFSCGVWCATAYQIRRVTANEEAYFFDWLISKGQSYDFLLKDNADFLKYDGWQLIDDDFRLLDKYSGLAFQHEFKAINGRILTEQVPQQLKKTSEKFIYLKEKLVDALNNSVRPVVVRANPDIVTLNDARLEYESLKQVFWQINERINFLVLSTQLEQEFINERYAFLSLAEVRVRDRDSWKGDNVSWERAFAIAEQHFRFASQN